VSVYSYIIKDIAPDDKKLKDSQNSTHLVVTLYSTNTVRGLMFC